MISTLAEFRKRCQRLYFAFDGLSAGRRLLVDHYQETLKPEYRNVDFALAYQVNNDPNNIDLTPVAVMKQGELIEATLPGGEFENINHQAVVVFVYHLWDELYRPQIAKIVQVENNKVEWDLLGDLKLIRNAIIHNQSKLSMASFNRLIVLRTIWNLKPAQLKLTHGMMNRLFDQFNHPITLRFADCIVSAV